MKVVELQHTFTLDSVAVAERPEPRPGFGEALVRVRACSLNYRDLLILKGLYNKKLPLLRRMESQRRVFRRTN